ncbi:FAD-dependent oxidoreductase [Amnibacterium sp.]|uniref:NAD(P)/FAD-dependent oxidoreductase n=1 Tax=Amnibacterium sp. TaxID=1872496 RepID=UPI0026238437|nr:FAD-dependent oxidoreductase [Amnibacterium sp.]MCU1473079.1 pyridine nucleotide-disulfide oxidoreductase [Amnibacterium sp.]
MPRSRSKVLVLGGGYVGLYVAWTLEKHTEVDLDITVVEPRAYMTYQPLLPEVAGGHVDPRNVTVDLRQAFSHAKLLRASVTGLDSQRRVVTVRTIGGEEQRLDYDHVVIGMGAVSRVFPTPGLAERGIGFKTIEEAVGTRNTVLENVARAAAATDPVERRKYLTFVFVGGGYTGVEALSELSDLSKKAIAAQPALRGERPTWVLIEALDRVAPEVGPELSAWTLEELRGRGIDIRLRTTLKSCEDDVAQLSDGDSFPFGMIVWTAGVKPNPALDTMDLPRGPKGHVVANERLQVVREDGSWVRGVWAAGDIAQIPDTTKRQQPAFYPPNAQNALRQGVLLARNIVATIEGSTVEQYRHASLGTVASYGVGHGAALIKGVKLRGLPAWAAHRAYHGLVIPSLNRKVRVFAGWITEAISRPEITSLVAVEHPTRAFHEAFGTTPSKEKK